MQCIKKSGEGEKTIFRPEKSIEVENDVLDKHFAKISWGELHFFASSSNT